MRGASFLLLLSFPVALSGGSSKPSPATKGKLIARKGLLRRLRDNRDEHISSKPIINTLSQTDDTHHPVIETLRDATEESELMELMRHGEEYLRQRGLELEETASRPTVGVSSNSEPDDTRAAIEHLIRERSLARASRNYAEADAIKEELRVSYRVEIFDRSGEWRDENGRYGRFGVATAVIRNHDPQSSLSRDEIQDMVDQRTLLRRERNFSAADEIRDKLLSHGVELFDKLNEWETFDGSLRGLQSRDRPPSAESITTFHRLDTLIEENLEG